MPKASDFEEWLAAERAVWRARSVEVLVHRVEELLGSGNAPDAAAVARRALALDPRSEPALRAAVRSLALTGDRAGSLELYDRFVARLADELGASPSAELGALAERVRRQRLVRPTARSGGASMDDGASSRLPLVGRDVELRRLLDAAAAAAAARRAAALVIVGDSGAGKTRLVEELLARLRLDGVTVAAARAIESDRARAVERRPRARAWRARRGPRCRRRAGSGDRRLPRCGAGVGRAFSRRRRGRAVTVPARAARDRARGGRRGAGGAGRGRRPVARPGVRGDARRACSATWPRRRSASSSRCRPSRRGRTSIRSEATSAATSPARRSRSARSPPSPCARWPGACCQPTTTSNSIASCAGSAPTRRGFR